jgi:hypothetical protein
MTLAVTDVVITAIVCLLAGGAVMWGVLRKAGRGGRTEAVISIEQMRSVGELVVFRILAKEIVTHTEHWAGEFGRQFLGWLWSERKLAMVFEFDIDFRYDLRGSDFVIEQTAMGGYRLQMPSCRYEVGIKKSSVYDFQSGRLRLLPDIIGLFGGSASKEDLNKLMTEAQRNIEQTAEQLITSKRGDIEQSARQTMEALAKGFGAPSVNIDFSESQFIKEQAAA